MILECPGPIRVCPECKGENVQELLLVWYGANDGRPSPDDSGHLAGLYSEPFYCVDCEKTLKGLTEKEEAKQ